MLKALSQKSYLGSQKDYNILPSITLEEQKKLFQKMEKYPENKQEIKNEIVEKNMGLIDFWMRRTEGLSLISGLEPEDIKQAGRIGLMRAIEKFRWRKGYRFSTYAIPWINQAMKRAIHNQSNIISIPIYKIGMITRYRRVKRELYQELGRSPSIREIAVKMDINEAEINHLKEIGKTPLSLEAPFSAEDGDNSLIDTIVDKKAIDPMVRLEREDLRKELAKALSCLSTRERKILIMRFGLENEKRYTLKEIGKIIYLSRERVRQIEGIALRKMKKILKSK
jgi:RNA polymerase primary sigma factor